MFNNKTTRSANGTGSIRQRADGKWEGIITVGLDPATGKPKKKSVYAKTQREVRKKVTEILQQLDGGTYITPTEKTVKQWMSEWITEFNQSLKPRTIRNYSYFINTLIIPQLGVIQLKQLTTIQIQHLYNQMHKDGKADSTIVACHRVFHKSL